MSDTTERDAVLDRYSGGGWDFPDHEAMADRIVELEAAVERVRALHNRVDSVTWSNNCCNNCLVDFPCPTLRALDGAP